MDINSQYSRGESRSIAALISTSDVMLEIVNPLPAADKGKDSLADKATPLLYIAVFRGGSSGFHGQVGTFGLSAVADLGEDGGGKSHE